MMEKTTAASRLRELGLKFTSIVLDKENLEVFVKPDVELRAATIGNTENDAYLREMMGPEIVELVKAGKSIPLDPKLFDISIKYHIIQEA